MPERYSPAGPSLLIHRADLDGRRPVDVVVERGRITGLLTRSPRRWAGPELDAGGAALLPGLHDHHLHLRALAAARRSVSAGPPEVTDPAGLAAALRSGAEQARAAGRAWVRAVGYHDSVAGPLDRAALDALVPDMPVRVQDRTGAVWLLNSRAVEALGLAEIDEPGVERRPDGDPTGRLFRMDAWLAERTRAERTGPPGDGTVTGAAMAEVSRLAAARGVTGFTDATPGLTPADLEYWAGLTAEGRLLQRLTLMWSRDTGLAAAPGAAADGRAAARMPADGPLKILLDDVDLPALDDLTGVVAGAHEGGRPVAVHCVTRAQTVLTVAALAEAGPLAGDRLEHGSLIPHESVPELARLGVTVVTNPSLLRERGDRYLTDVDATDRSDLYRCASLRAGGVAVAGGTDAPFGNPDPWVSIRAAVERRTLSGAEVGPGERLEVAVALGLFTGRPDAPAVPRTTGSGEPADLCVLDRSWNDLVRTPPPELSAALVRATVIGGVVVHSVG